ncbi:MAG: YkgJ family cysteine cluster protein [Desulfobacterales bacterium]|jgi:Fe-S-cluster containining protein
MKHIDFEDIDKLPGIRLKEDDRFKFCCYPEVSCFNRCCRNLNLFLYPYDVVRLKQSLGLTSDQFLDEYVDVVLRPANFFPEVLLRMTPTPEKTCPFLTDSGCSVYPDRPDTCRTFPLEQGMLYDAQQKKDTAVYFFKPPDFCRGQDENEEWTIAEWSRDQETERHHRLTKRWAEVKRLFQEDPWGIEGPEGSKAKMAFMATYNIDRFREFIFQSSFAKRYKVKSTLLKKLKTDDVHLLKFGFEWVKFFVWGIKSKNIRVR